MRTRRALLGAALSALASAGVRAQGGAAAYPSRPIRWIVPFTPGGGADLVARLVGEHLTGALGQPVIIENRGGAGGMIGTDAVAKAAPDGYTWLQGNDGPITMGPTMAKAPYDVHKDFQPVSLITRLNLLLVANPALAANDVPTLVAMGKAPASKLTLATAGNGSISHFAAEYFRTTTGIEVLMVPYRGVQEAITDVIGGRMDLFFTATSSALQNMRSGKLKAIAIASRQRNPTLPDVPTIAESGYPGFEIDGWHGVLMPAGTPRAIVDRVSEEIAKAVRQPALVERLNTLGLVPVGSTPEMFGEMIAADYAKWSKLVQTAGIKP